MNWSDIERPNYADIKLAGRQYNIKNVEIKNLITTETNDKIIGKKKFSIHGSFAGKVKIIIATIALLAALAAGAAGITASQEQSHVDWINNQPSQTVTLQTTDGNYINVPQKDYEIYAQENPEPTPPYSAPDSNISPMENDVYPSSVIRR